MKPVKKKLFILLLVAYSTAVFAQSVDEIKKNRDTYLWGEGSGSTVNKADQLALDNLISQISVAVESKFTLLKQEVMNAGKSDFKEECVGIVNTYSAATLTNTERIVISNEPDAVVFRYIKKADLDKIFQNRKLKIIDFARIADKAAKNGRMADALKYYYWSLTLLRSHPDGNNISYVNPEGVNCLLLGYLPVCVNKIFDGIKVAIMGIEDEPEHRMVKLNITSDGTPVENLEYSYWDGRDWSATVAAKDGTGFIEFFGENASSHIQTQLKAEYIFEGEARIDRELEEVLKRLDPIPFKNAYINLNFEQRPNDLARNPKTPALESPNGYLANLTTSVITETDYYQTIVDKVLDVVQSRKYEQAKPFFTHEGFQEFNQLLAYGKAKVLSNDSLRAIKMGKLTICRGPKMSFSFSNSRRKFVEDVVFHFNPEGKIETLSFGLNQKALASILSRTVWSEAERLTLINFMEHYKTAYALKRLDYIRSIFADDALIIIGNVLKIKPNAENPFLGNKIVKYNRISKEQYIKNLEHTFASNEFINIGFEESDVRKGGKEGDMFGIQIKQNYFSENYGDAGYLFLLIDFNKPDEPTIHVRTWQPQKNDDGSIYGIESF